MPKAWARLPTAAKAFRNACDPHSGDRELEGTSYSDCDLKQDPGTAPGSPGGFSMCLSFFQVSHPLEGQTLRFE